jgi:glycerol-1-phosphate dehydrogenase [NAD(P)+]
MRGAPAFHGAKVGVSAVIMLKIFKWLSEEQIDWDYACKSAGTFDIMVWQNNIRRVYGRAAEGVLALWQGESPEARARLVSRIKENWPGIASIAAKAEDPNNITSELIRMGGPSRPAELGINATDFNEGLLYANRVRKRFTVMRMADIIGLLPIYIKRLNM